MAIQTSGSISLNDIHVEAGGVSGTTCTINDADIRALISKASGVQMSFNEWYGASSSVSLDFRIYGGRGAANTSGNYNAQSGRGYGGYTRCQVAVPGGTQFQLYSGGRGTNVPSNGGRIDWGAPGGGASVVRWTSGGVILGIAGGGGGGGGEGYGYADPSDGRGGNGGGANSGGNAGSGDNSVWIGGGGGGGSGGTGGSAGASTRGNPGNAGTSTAGGSGKNPLTSYAYGANSLGYNGGYGGNGASAGDGFGGGGGGGYGGGGGGGGNAGGGGGGGGGGYGRTSAYSGSSTVTVTGSNGSRNGVGYIYIYIGATLVKNVTSSGSSANSGTYTA